MRIKQLELLGFKSFKNKTTLTFPAGITAVVGPNGCGKSNIVDALRWVLGEQSPKQLRGQEMSDVVFAGSEGNAPLGMADVTLLLENTDAPGHVTNGKGHNGGAQDWTEVMISRRYFRSGESEYLFNKVPCRLRDIVEFFLGTGAGTKAYSIIEQGRVDALVSAKPQDIRIFVEEAAGTSLYRSRRLAAERKLERTQDNLSRVADILHEMDRQLASLRRQAKKAERYRSLQDELKTVDLTLLCHAYQTLAEELSILSDRLKAQGQEEGQLSQQAESMQAERSATSARIESEEATLRELEERLHALENRCDQGEQKHEFLLQQEEQTRTRTRNAEDERRLMAEKKDDVRRELIELSGTARDMLQQADDDKAALQTQEQELATLQDAGVQRETQAEELKTEIVDLLTQEAQIQNTLSYSRKRTSEVTQRLDVLTKDAQQVEQLRQETEQALSALQEKSIWLSRRVQHGQQQREEKSGGLRETRSAGEQLDTTLSGAWTKQAELRARLTTLKELEHEYDRYAQGVQSVMTDGDFPASVLGVVAQMIEVPQAYERAVAAVLRDKLEYMVVADTATGVVAVDYLNQAQSGHGNFVPIRLREGAQVSYQPDPNGPVLATVGEGVSPLMSCVAISSEYRQMIEALLGDAVLVPSLQVGLDLWNGNMNPHTYVTPQGEMISALGVVSGGSGGVAEAALLERRREIRGLTQTIARQEETVADLVQRRQTVKQRQHELEGELARFEAEARTLGQENEALQREVGKLEGELRRLLDRGEGIGYERNVLEQEYRTLRAEMLNAQIQEQEISTQRQERQSVLSSQQAEVAQAKVNLDRQRAAIDDLRVRVAEQRERHEGLQTQVTRLTSQIRELEERLRASQAVITAGTEELQQLQTEKAALRSHIEQTQVGLDAAKEEQARRQSACAALRVTYQTCEERVDEIRQATTQLQEEKTRIEVRSAEKRVSSAHLESTVRERYDLALTSVLGQYATEELNQAEGETQRQELREKLTRLGEVNPSAATELAEVEERFIFVESQKGDLLHSIEDLQNTIHKLNRESHARFRETFHLVDEKFCEVYARLVEGGRAQISLTNEADLSESGVEISVQPPNKRLRSMQLLSGGEKALVALSFTFALFLIRPSPFCILDEVDAPLDDANVGRFNQLLREMSETTQIVLITHNKRTMEAADTLYGVTMQEPGVSTMVSVRVS